VPISIVVILISSLIVIAGTILWVRHTKDVSKRNFVKCSNLLSSVLFYGTALLLIAVTLIWEYA